jgi:hypothetical protein
MIYFNFTLRNPWSGKFEHKFAASKKISKHKCWEFEIYQCDTVLELEGRISVREDHAGVMLGVGLFSYVMRFQIYDTRHWNFDKQQWEIYDA